MCPEIVFSIGNSAIFQIAPSYHQECVPETSQPKKELLESQCCPLISLGTYPETAYKSGSFSYLESNILLK
jgi:hypothetical protein